MAIKKDPTTSIREHVNELKVQEKTLETAIKQDLSTDHNTLITLCFRGKNITTYPNIGSLEAVIEWNKICEEFIFKAYKSFRRRFDTIIFKKWWPYWVNLLFCCLFFKIKIDVVLLQSRLLLY